MAEPFTGMKGKYVKLSETIDGFERLLNGEFDNIQEDYFYMKGNINDVLEAYNNANAKSNDKNTN